MQGFSGPGWGGPWSVLAAAGAVGLCVPVLSVPMILAGWSLSPDSNEYLQIAHAWSQGASFVPTRRLDS